MSITLLRLRGRGHPAIRATHRKTLEVTATASVTSRATCVVAVGTVLAGGTAYGGLPDGGIMPLAGPVRIHLWAGREHAVIHAIANPRWHPGGSAVIRRSGNRLPDTLATDADLAAADLPRGLAERLADPDSAVEITVERASGHARLVLLWTTEADARLAAEAAAADLVIAEDKAAAGLLAGLPRGSSLVTSDPAGNPARARARHQARTPAPNPAGTLGRTPARDPARTPAPNPAGTQRKIPARDRDDNAAWAAEALADGGRVLVVSSAQPPGWSVASLLAEPDVRVEVAGLPAALAVASASPSRAPLLLATECGRRETLELVRSAPLDVRLVVTATADGLAALLRAAHRARGTVTAAVAGQPYWQSERPQWGPVGALGPRKSKATVVCCLDPVAAAMPAAGRKVDQAGLLVALQGQGVSARTLAQALATLPGWSRRQAYDLVGAIAADDADGAIGADDPGGAGGAGGAGGPAGAGGGDDAHGTGGPAGTVSDRQSP